MKVSQLIVYSGIIVPASIYISLVTHVFYSTFSRERISPQKLGWFSDASIDQRKEIVLNRSEPLLAYKECLSGKGEWYHLEHFTEDVIFQSPLVKLEGKDELSSIFVTLMSKLVEDVIVDMISVQQNEELMTIEMTIHVIPILLPTFSLPLTSSLNFEQVGDKQKIYKIKEEWNGVKLLNGRLHSWLRRIHAVIAMFICSWPLGGI